MPSTSPALTSSETSAKARPAPSPRTAEHDRRVRACCRARSRRYSSPRAPRGRCRSCARSPSPCRCRPVGLGDDAAAVAEDRDRVGDRQHVVEEMRDEDDAAAAGAQPRSTSNRRSTSGGDSAEVGSSRMMMRAPENSTRASSISCCRPIGSEPMRALRIDVDAEARRAARARRATMRAPVDDAEPRRRLLAEKDVLGDGEVGHDAQLLMHHADAGGQRIARRAEVHLAARRSSCGRRYSRCTPAMIFISVDLPAPFSPTRPWISPARSAKSTSRSAATPPNDLEMPACSSQQRRRSLSLRRSSRPRPSWRRSPAQIRK